MPALVFESAVQAPGQTGREMFTCGHAVSQESLQGGAACALSHAPQGQREADEREKGVRLHTRQRDVPLRDQHGSYGTYDGPCRQRTAQQQAGQATAASVRQAWPSAFPMGSKRPHKGVCLRSWQGTPEYCVASWA